MLQLKHQVLDHIPKNGFRAILGLDLTKTFDNVAHQAILENLLYLDVGQSIYNYIKDFLNHRTAELRIGELQSDKIPLGGRGTPQESVLSPFLFNLATIRLPEQLNQIPDLHHSPYADDITLWMVKRSDGDIETTLQQAVDTVEKYVTDKGLACSRNNQNSSYSERLQTASPTLRHPQKSLCEPEEA
nr:uncharacterized protein LOC126518199 [Dermacentor andersoni]